MCLVGLAIGSSTRFPFVMGANRDELFSREAAPLDWWEPNGILAGRDLQAGGTWLGVTSSRIALVTNVREPAVPVGLGAPSRGEIVRYWLGENPTLDELERRVLDSDFAGVNVLAFDLKSGEQAHISNRGTARTALVSGIHGLSNASLDTPWPKVACLDTRIMSALDAGAREDLTKSVFAALADDKPAQEGLPSTGVPLEIERALSSAFIRIPGMRYGTRCSTVLVREGQTLHVTERTFDSNGDPVGDRDFAVTIEA